MDKKKWKFESNSSFNDVPCDAGDTVGGGVDVGVGVAVPVVHRLVVTGIPNTGLETLEF